MSYRRLSGGLSDYGISNDVKVIKLEYSIPIERVNRDFVYLYNRERHLMEYYNIYALLDSENQNRIYQYSLNGTYLGTYPSISDASIDLGNAYNCIADTISGKRDSCGNYRWTKVPYMSLDPLGNLKEVYICAYVDYEDDVTHEILYEVRGVYDTLRQASSVTGDSLNDIINSLRNKTRTSNGIWWVIEKL